MARTLISAGQPSAGSALRHYALERAQFVRWLRTSRDTLLQGQLGPMTPGPWDP